MSAIGGLFGGARGGGGAGIGGSPAVGSHSQIDRKLRALGYTEEEGLVLTGPFDEASRRASNPKVGGLLRGLFEMQTRGIRSQVKELLKARQRFIDADTAVRTQSPRGRSANVRAGSLNNDPNTASRTLVGI